MAELAKEPVAEIDAASTESDMDSLHAMPLSIIPLETPALALARMVKNNHMLSVIEFFNEKATGSGQIDIDAVPSLFGWPDHPEHPDFAIVRKLGTLPCYDVYSLRILLREVGIPVNDFDSLKLSDNKARELNDYMTKFTRPLIMQIFSDEDASIRNIDDLFSLFKQPDVSKALTNLEIMAKKLNIELNHVPKFLEDYGDIFMSLSYYRKCLDAISKTIDEFISSLHVLRTSLQIRNDPGIMQTCETVEDRINELTASVTGRFESMDRNSRDMWNDISAERFRKVETMIRSYHVSTGAILCGLTVKMSAWKRAFPTMEHLSPGRLAGFIVSDIRQGLDNIRRFEDSAPMLSQLN